MKYQRRPSDANNLPHLRTFRTELRSKLTPAEAAFWTIVKDSQLDGRKFRRQHSVGRYILDFYCPSERLGIELDGPIHRNHSAIEYDRERDLFLEHFGIKVLRFENKWVFEERDMMMNHILQYFGCRQRTTPSSEADATPPS